MEKGFLIPFTSNALFHALQKKGLKIPSPYSANLLNSPFSKVLMAKLHPDEREALRKFSQFQALPRQLTPVIPISDYMRYLSQLPDSLCPPKAVRFTGRFWKL